MPPKSHGGPSREAMVQQISINGRRIFCVTGKQSYDVEGIISLQVIAKLDWSGRGEIGNNG